MSRLLNWRIRSVHGVRVPAILTAGIVKLIPISAFVSCAVGCALVVVPARGQTTSSLGADNLPAWVNEVGARQSPKAPKVFLTNTYGAIGNGVINSTRAIQKAIDACALAGGGIVSFKAGSYVTGAIFLKSNVELRVDKDVMLLGSQQDKDYPILWTRVAGIEMDWPAGLININEQHNVKISGGGTIDGRGEKWWEKYWRLRIDDYGPRGLRWAADYDAQRVRLIVVWKCSDVTLENLNLRRSGFWTVQVVYSDHVTVDHATIRNNTGPSTDGVDIDSSDHVLVENCDIDNNDDDICLKAGRDSDGLRVNRPTEYIVIRDNIARSGGGVITFGSETSGGIRKVVALNNRGIGTKEGIRFKSATTRGGFVEDVLIRGLQLEDVPLPFSFTLDWNPSYSYTAIPKDIKDIPRHWVVLTTPVPPALGLCEFRNITIEDVQVVGAHRIFSAIGLPQKPIRGVVWRNVTAEGNEAGNIEYASDWKMTNVQLQTEDGEPVKATNNVNVDAPHVVKRVATQ